jgi:hypothetical protein
VADSLGSTVGASKFEESAVSTVGAASGAAGSGAGVVSAAGGVLSTAGVAAATLSAAGAVSDAVVSAPGFTVVGADAAGVSFFLPNSSSYNYLL